MASTLVTIVLIHTCLRIKRSMPLDKEATRSDINLVAVTRTEKDHAVVDKDAEKGKGKKGKGKGKRERQARFVPRNS